jgi:hypothetical protein
MRRHGNGMVVVTANIPTRLDGMHYANAREPEDTGIALWWIDRKSGEQRVVACDQWKTVRENMRACGLALEAMRAIERSGATQILERAMQTFATKGLPPSKPEWFYVLGLKDFPPTRAQVTEAFRARSRVCHPDVAGGSHQLFVEIEQAQKEALRWLEVSHG